MANVTIALITYNRTKYLQYAIDAIINQTYKNFELIIMDNGSTEETYELVKKKCYDNRIIYHRNPCNNINYMNVAFTLGTGKYLLITHDDDIMMSNMLEEEVKILESYPKSVIVGVNAKLIDENGNVIKEKGNKHEDDLVFKKYEYVNAFLNKGLFLYCPTVLMRRSFFSENNLKFDLSYGPSFAWDNFLWFRINLLYDVELISLEKQLYYYRIHQNQASHKKYFMNSLLYKKTIQFLGENLEKDRAKSFVEMIIFRMAVNSSQSLNEKIISQKEFIQDIHDSKILLKEWELDGFISIIKLAGIRYISYSILHKIKQLYVYFKKLFL